MGYFSSDVYSGNTFSIRYNAYSNTECKKTCGKNM